MCSELDLFDMREEIWRFLRLKYPRFRPVGCNPRNLVIFKKKVFEPIDNNLCNNFLQSLSPMIFDKLVNCVVNQTLMFLLAM